MNQGITPDSNQQNTHTSYIPAEGSEQKLFYAKEEDLVRMVIRYGERVMCYLEDENGEQVTLEWFNIGYGYAYCKYMVYPSEGTVSERNYRVMRYAEALLFYAEILNETGDQEGATKQLNKVRQRAMDLFNSDDATYIPATKTHSLYTALRHTRK